MRIPAVFMIAFLVFSLANPGFGFGQPRGSTSIMGPGEHVKNAAVKASHGKKAAIKDSDITGAVKLALHHDLTKGSDIHVKTIDGVVTLWGTFCRAAWQHKQKSSRVILPA